MSFVAENNQSLSSDFPFRNMCVFSMSEGKEEAIQQIKLNYILRR